MSRIVNINSINPITFEYQTYSIEDNSLIFNTNVDTVFDPTLDIIEYFVYDLNNQIVYSNVTGYPGYTINDKSVVLDPERDLVSQGFTIGQYNTVYNFISPKLASNSTNPYFIAELSSDRTEVRLDTTNIPDVLVISSSLELTNDIANSTGSYYDFYLDFGSNQLVIANNILLDTSSINNPTILVKLYEPLPEQFTINSQLWVVTQLANPVAYNINLTQTFEVTDDNIYLKGPNTNLSIKNQINNSTDYSNSSQLSVTDSTQGSGSLRYQLNSLLAKTGIEINVDYSNYDNFIHFSSAQTRLENFYYKLSLIEQYNYSASLSSGTTANYYVSSSNVIFQSKINEIITGFDNYEYFLYFNSGSDSWPKTGSTPPYTNYTTTSTSGSNWFISQSAVAEEYDIENNNALINAIPSYLLEDPANAQYELFIEMIGQHFDNVFLYTQDVTNKYNNDNRLNYGVSKDLVADILRDMGIKIYQNNFSTNDLYSALLGLTPSGSLYNLPYTTGSLPTPTGYEYINTYITASSTSSLIPTEDINAGIYKRIYANLPYLLKKKGTVEGLRALITTYGIPDTILQVNEFGGQNKIIENDYDFWFNQYNFAYYTSGSSYISSSFALNSAWNASNDRPQAVEFRFRTDGLPQNTASIASQSLWETDTSVKLVLKYTGSGYTSGSYSGSIINPYNQYGRLELIPDPLSPNSSASVYLPFFNEGWWSVLVNKVGTVYTLHAKDKNYEGEDGNTIGFQASSSVDPFTEDPWNNAVKSYFGISSSLAGKYFTGSFQEIRYYVNTLNSSSFNDYVMNPYSIDANGINTAPDTLAFRATLGGELYTSSISVHPKITGSWITTQSFDGDISTFYFNQDFTVFVPNTESFFLNQFPAGIKNRVSNKIRQQGEILPYSGSNETNLPTNQVLSPFISIQQSVAVSGSYTPNIDYVEVAFSPQNQINNDIAGQLGYFNIGEYIGDPRLVSSSAESYPALDGLRNYYFEKYTGNYNIWDYIRLIKYFDNSLFKMIQDFTPARTDLASGIVIKQTTLERNKYPVPQPNITSSIAMVESGSTNIPYQTENILITGSAIQMYTISGSTGGTMPNLFGLTSSQYTGNGIVNITQSWSGSTPSLSGSVPFVNSTQEEFYNGELSGSVIQVTDGTLSDCNVEIVQVYTTASVGGNLTPSVTYSSNQSLMYDIDVNKSYYITFTAANDVGSLTDASVMIYDNSGRIFYSGTNAYNPGQPAPGASITVNKLQINNPFYPLYFASATGVNTATVTNIFVYEDYIEPDCLVVAGNVDVARVNPEFFDVDFSSNAITAVNASVIISASRGTGSATPSTTPASNYTTARIINPRYVGSKNTSTDFNIIDNTKLPSVEQLTSYFIYTPGGLGNTLAERSGSGNYKIGFLVDELGNITQPNNNNTSSAYIPNLIDAFGADSTVILSPNNNTTLAQSEFTVYKPAVISNIILFSDTGSLGTKNLVSGSYTSLNFNIVPGLYTQPYALNVSDNAQSIPSGATPTTASFPTINQDQAGGFNNTNFVYTVQNTSPVRAAFSASFEIENLGAVSTNVQIRLLENNIQIAQQNQTLASGGSPGNFLVTSSLFLNANSEYYVTIRSNNENVDVNDSLWTIAPIISTSVSKPYFTTGNNSPSVLTSSAALGVLYGTNQQTLPLTVNNTSSGFDQPQPLTFLPYDEIRFEGNENLVSTIISSSFNQSTGRFFLFLQQPIDTNEVDVNYFAIRRWVSSIDNIIINSPGTLIGSGFIFPKYLSPLLSKNLPTIIENLTNKGLV